MTFREWFKKAFPVNTDPNFESGMREAWCEGYNNGYDLGQAEGYQEGTRNGMGLDDGRT